MSTLSKKIFHSAIIVALLVLVACVVLIMGVLFDYFETSLENELKEKAEYIAYAVNKEGIELIEGYGDEESRISIIASDGTVIYDTAADTETLSNHSDREEIIEALETGTGSSTRYSETLTEKTVYYAILLDDGSVLRVAATQYTVVTVLLGLVRPILVVLAIALVLSLLLSLRASKSIVEPINNLNLDSPEKNETYEELTPLLNKLSAQRRTIAEQIKSAEKQQSEFRLITENMSEGFLVIDKDLCILTYNSAALSLLGLSTPVTGSVLRYNRTKGLRTALESALSGEKAESTMEVNSRCYSLIASPVYEENAVIGAVIIILDVTESQEREQLRREFTSNVSHELKTPLTSISGFAEMLMAGDVPAELSKDFSKSIYDEAQRLIALIGDIIKLSELDEGDAGGLERENVDLKALSESVRERLMPEAEKKGVELSVEGESASVFGILRILDEMIYNLADNAVKYNHSGGKATISVSDTDESVILKVSDTGCGIPQSETDRVFERFYRVDKSRSGEVPGTGLGLSIVKHGAIYHDAKITLDSKEGVGTTVTIEFPKQVR